MGTALFANRNIYIGLFFTSFAILMYEILLTRIFSVLVYYHFAFMSISIAMFGLTLGSMLVYLLPSYKNSCNLDSQFTTASLLFSVTIVQSFLVMLSIPLQFHLTVSSLLLNILFYFLIALPFVFGGIVICLALTKYIQQINSLYAVDLLGAGIGCIAIVLLIDTFSAATAIFIIAIFAGIGAIVFSSNIGTMNLLRTSIVCTLFLCFLAVANIILEKIHHPIFRFSWVKNHFEPVPIYEKWNSFSRLTIAGDPLKLKPPFGWGFGSNHPNLQHKTSNYLWLSIDSGAATTLTQFNNLNELDYLKYDVVNTAHYLRSKSKVLVIGVGGGRDILSALYFKQPSVTGIEINPNIIDILTHRFADYSHHLANNPHVSLINDEARSYITRMHQQFDIIQMSLIDTWAATGAGAFALSENSLYTLQSWMLFLNHLTPNGIFTASRWYSPQHPAEMYRAAVLARAALLKSGIDDPERHIIIVTSLSPDSPKNSISVATILVSKSIFTQQDITLLETIAKKMNFSLLFPTKTIIDPTFNQLISNRDISSILAKSDLDLTPPTDDNPFFFQLIKIKNIFNGTIWKQDVFANKNIYIPGITTIAVLLITVIFLTFLCILIPLKLATKNVAKNAGPLVMYASCIGLGFMLVEISQIQRLTLFLGSPTYGLSVVLFTLLIACGLGNLFAGKRSSNLKNSLYEFIAIFAALAIYGFYSSQVITHFQTSSTGLRIIAAAAMVLPIGFFMGQALPIGLKLTNRYNRDLTAWMWAVNGATSICGSVLAIAFALSFGIANSFWIGVLCYLIAFTAYFLQSKHLQLSR